MVFRQRGQPEKIAEAPIVIARQVYIKAADLADFGLGPSSKCSHVVRGHFDKAVAVPDELTILGNRPSRQPYARDGVVGHTAWHRCQAGYPN